MTTLGFFALLIMQVGPNPSLDAYPGTPEELRNRPPREGKVIEAPQPQRSRLSRCLLRAGEDPQAALDFAQAWRETGDPDELAQTSHCAGLALVRLGRLGDAQRVFRTARDEVDADNPAYRARLGAMAGHAAMADGDAGTALPYFELAVADAVASADGTLQADVELDRAGALVALDRADEAVAPLENARNADPANARAWLLSATLSRRLGRYGEAQEQIEYAADLAPRDAAIGLEAGVIAASSGRAEDARRSFDSVVALAPESGEAERARAYLRQLSEGSDTQ